MIWLLTLVIGLSTAFWLRWRHKNKRLLEMANKLPGPRSLPIVGNALQFMCHLKADGIVLTTYTTLFIAELIKVIKNLIEDYGDALKFWLGPDLNVVITNPDDLKILLSNAKTSVKGPQYKYMADILGGGILSGSGPAWRRHRKIATPNYGKRAIESYNKIFNQEVDLLLDQFKAVPAGININIYTYIVQSTSYAVCQTLIGLNKEQTMNLPNLHRIIDLTHRIYDIVFGRMTKWYLQIDLVYWMTDFYQQQKRFIKATTEFSKTIIQCRKDKLNTLKEESQRDLMNTDKDELINTELSVIDRFILSQELNDEELVQETFTIFTSSQEASAKISSFLLLMMAYHPKYQEKLYAEIKSVIGDEDRWVSDKDLKQMPYLDMVFKEVLRLYPIGAILQRSINEDITISSGTLPAGCSLVVPIYHLHRDPRFWTRPEEFDPERFNPVNMKLRHPNCYIPFSIGPMDCLGRYFGTKLVKTICVRMLTTFELTSMETYKDLRLSIAISASSLNGYHTMLHPRKQSHNKI